MTKKKTAAERRTRNYVVFSGAMVAIMGFSLLAPLVRTAEQQQAQQIQPTSTPAPVLPTPIADLSTITFGQQVVSESGLFSVALPTGYEVGTNTATANEAQLTERNAGAGSVIEARVIVPETPITDVAGVKAYFGDAWLASSWRDYTSWDKASDQIEGEDYVADFSLSRTNSDFVARQKAWTDGTWVYMVRVVTPPNATEQLTYILDNVKASLTPNKQFVGAPVDWKSSFDSANNTLIRFPSTWSVTDSGVGVPTSLAGDGATIRVETLTAALADADAASAWVTTTYGATVTSTESIDRFGTAGYAVAYQLPNVDGGSSSGYTVLLVGDGVVHVADLRIPSANVDLNSAEAAAQYSALKGIMESFGVLNIAPAV